MKEILGKRKSVVFADDILLNTAMARPKKTLRDRLLGHLARRDHSPKELYRKLKPYAETAQELEETIQWADDLNLIKTTEQLTETFARHFHQRLKAHRHIQAQLSSKGLPPPAKDADLELKKALQLARKWRISDRQKVARRLGYRGFDSDTIRKALQGLEQDV